MSIGVGNCPCCGFAIDEPVNVREREYCSVCAEAMPKKERFSVPLRPYQEEAVLAVADQLRTQKSTLVVMPTGTGKTILMAGIAERHTDGRILVIAHREELIDQNADKISRFSGVECDIEMGDRRADHVIINHRAPVVVTSVQTMSRQSHHQRFNPHEFSLVIIDEAHHAPARTYRLVLEHFGQNPDLKLLGVTATPDRADEEALGQVFETVAYEYSIVQAIDDGWLVPIEQQFIHVEGLDFSTIKTTGGDLNSKQLADVLEQEKILHGYAWPIIEIAQGEKTLVFAASVDQAEQLAEIFNRHQSGCARWICADQTRCSHEERQEALRGFTRGDFQFLVNCGILLEGYDEPSIRVIAIARPTKSRSLYAQMIGRGTRTLTGLIDGISDPIARRSAIAGSDKSSVLILDFVGNSGRHKLIHTGDILGGNYDDDLILDATNEVQAKNTRGERADMLNELRSAEERRRERNRKAVTAQSKYQATRIDPFAVWDVLPKREPGWHKGRKPTPKQLAFLEKRGMPTRDVTFWQASQIIDEAIKRSKSDLCTYKQGKVLTKFGFSTDVSFKDASATIDAIAKSGWTLRYASDVPQEALR